MSRNFVIIVIMILLTVLLTGCVKTQQVDPVVDQRLAMAVQNNDLETLHLLVQSGVAVNATTPDRAATVLMMAVRTGIPELVKFLLENGADVNITNRDGETALFFAVYHGRADLVNMLLDKGASVYARRSKVGVTPLHVAAARGDTEIVKVLLAKGADVNAAAAGGVTAMRLARELDQQKVAEVLKAAGSKE
jgi:uncharacterized protein